jgi:FixJ family two-component response regulator
MKKDFRTVYVVDDDEAVRDSLRALLETYGVMVRDYASAEAYLAEDSRPAMGCLLLDLHMPGMAGLRLLEKLREQKISLPAIVLTGRSDVLLKKQAAQAGAFALLDKPVTDDVLLWTIESAIASQPRLG